MEKEINPETLAQGGVKFGNEAGEYRLVIGEKAEGLHDSLKVVTLDQCTFNGLEAFVKSRTEYIKSRKDESVLLLDATNTIATLNIGDKGSRKLVGDKDVTTSYVLRARTQRSKDFRDVLGYMKKNYESAQDFALELRQRPELFESISEMARVVGYLRSTTLKVKSIREEVFTDEGQREKRLRSELEGEQMNLVWNWNVPMFDGEPRVNIPVKAVWEVQGNMSVRLVLLDQGTVVQERTAKEDLMHRIATKFEQLVGTDVVPVVYVNGNQASVD